MTNDLREKIDQFHERLEGVSDLWEEASVELEFGEMLIEALEEGDLVTRTELEEAVAKAVAEEREAIEGFDWRDLWTTNFDRMRAAGESKEMAGRWFGSLVRDSLRARSEQKEGE